MAGIADFNGDTYEDILWRNNVTGQNWIFFMQNATILSSLGLNTVPAAWDVVGVGDYNADSYADVMWRNGTTGQNWIHFIIGNTVIASAGTSNVPDTNWEVMHRP